MSHLNSQEKDLKDSYLRKDVDLTPTDSRMQLLASRGTWEVHDARPMLPRAAFFMGDLRDGLPMLNMQAAFLISARGFTERQIGTLFLAFGLSQFLCMAPAGYFLDYSNKKIKWVIWSSFGTSALTLLTVLTTKVASDNMMVMIILHVIQGGLTAILPPGFNSITLGIVGGTGFTHQVSRNRMMSHIGTAIVVAVGSFMAYILYPNIGVLFITSPLAAIGVYYNLVRIKPNHIDRDAARGLIIESPTMNEYDILDTNTTSDGAFDTVDDSTDDSTDEADSNNEDEDGIFIDSATRRYDPPEMHMGTMETVHEQAGIKAPQVPTDDVNIKRESSNASCSRNENSQYSGASFNFGWRQRLNSTGTTQQSLKAITPIAALVDPTFLTFVVTIFCWHLANSSVLPLVMQSLSLEDPQAGILLSGLCILIGQGFMFFFAKACGDYSPKWGRKGLMLLGISSLTARCFILALLMAAQEQVENEERAFVIKIMILSTQLLDSVGAGILGTLHILVTNDISCETGRFSLMLGVTTGAMCLGATVSGYLGQAIAQDYGYPVAFTVLGVMSLVPLLLYTFLMPETLPDFEKPKTRRRRVVELLRKLNEKRRKLTNRFQKGKDDQISESLNPLQDASTPPTISEPRDFFKGEFV